MKNIIFNNKVIIFNEIQGDPKNPLAETKSGTQLTIKIKKKSATGFDTAIEKQFCTQTIIKIALFLNFNVGILP